MQFSRVIVAVVLSLLPFQLWAQDSKWFEVASPHFLLLTDTSEAKGRRLLTDLESRVSAFGDAFGSIPERQFPIQVFLLNRAEEFIEAVPIGGTVRVDKSAYLQNGPDRTFIIARDKSPEEIADDVGHALGHVFFERYVFWRPFWLAEAAGEFFRKVGRNPDTKAIPPADGFTVPDILTIVPSSTYQDNEPAGAFRTQSYRLLRILLNENRDALKDFLQILRTEQGNKAKPRIDEDAFDARLRSYTETLLTADAVPGDLKVAAVDSARVAVRRGDLMLAMGKTAEAGRWYNADSAEARAARAIATRFTRSGTEAVRSLDRTSREQPEAGLVQFHFGSLETQAAKDIELQVAALERAVKLMPLMGRAHAELARVYVLTGNAEKALPAIERAIQLEPEYADRFHEIRAEIFVGLNRLDAAYQTVQLASALPHKDRPTAELYERKIAAMARRVEDIRREGESARAEQLRNEVAQRAAELEPPKPPAPVQPVRSGQIAYQIEARARIEVIEQVFPEYPNALIQKGTAGNVTLQVSIGADGKVTNATIAASQVPELNAATIAAVKAWTFKPVILSGRAAPFTFRLVFQYMVQ